MACRWTYEIEPELLDPRDVVEALEATLPNDWEEWCCVVTSG
jgi:hypothetical protein